MLFRSGDPIAEDQPLVEVMTDKATVTIPSPKRGKVVRTHGKEGDIAKVHHTLVTLELDPDAKGAPAPASAAPAPAGLAVKASSKARSSSGWSRRATRWPRTSPWSR